MEINKVKEYYIEMWKKRLEELKELTEFIQTLD